MPVPPSKFVTADDATFAPFLKSVEADVDTTLATYDIQDKATMRDYLATRLDAALLAGDDATVRATVEALRAAETKPDLALIAGRIPLAYVSGDFARSDRAAVNALPWSLVADTVKAQAAFEPLTTRDSIVGGVAHDFDPIAAKTGTLDGPSARALVQIRAQLMLLPYLAPDAKILKAYIAKHNTVKPSIWAGREVTLAPSEVKAPVRIGILDSGVDPSDYRAQMYGGAAMAQHGLAFADDGTPSSSDLYPLPANVAADYPRLVKLLTGISDLQG